MFLSADSVQGNPETWSDPSGRYVVGLGGEKYYPGSPYYTDGNGVTRLVKTGQPYNNPNTNGQTGCGSVHIGAKTCTTTNSGKNQFGQMGGCDEQCREADLKLIQTHEAAVGTLVTDILAGVGSLGALLADWALGNGAGIVTDILSLIVQVGAVVRDIVGLKGEVPTWLDAIVNFGQLVVGAVNMVKGFLGFFGGISGVLDSFDFAKNAFTMAKGELSDLIQSGLSSFFGGGASYYSGAIGLRSDLYLNNLSDQDIHNQCLGEGLTGCI